MRACLFALLAAVLFCGLFPSRSLAGGKGCVVNLGAYEVQVKIKGLDNGYLGSRLIAAQGSVCYGLDEGGYELSRIYGMVVRTQTFAVGREPIQTEYRLGSEPLYWLVVLTP